MSAVFSLVIETSTPQASMALIGSDGAVDVRGFCSDRNHNAVLFGPLQELLALDGGRKVSMVIVGSGPGSYSGTRVGIAAAQGVAIALNCPAVAVPSILAVPPADGGAACLAVGDARRGGYWSARVAGSSLISNPELCDAEGLMAVVSSARAAGMAVFSFEDSGRFPLPDGGTVQLEIPDAMRLWRAWQATDEETRAKWMKEIPQPLYLKPPHITPGKRTSLLHPGR